MSPTAAPDAEQAFAHLHRSIADALAAEPARRVHLIGIHSGGAWIAERLHQSLALSTPLGTLSSAFRRAGMQATDLPFEIGGADIVLVDDILFTGRTVRAALNELFDYGRPARVELAVLLDRGGRELPIEARFCGARHYLEPARNFVLSRDPRGQLNLVIE